MINATNQADTQKEMRASTRGAQAWQGIQQCQQQQELTMMPVAVSMSVGKLQMCNIR